MARPGQIEIAAGPEANPPRHRAGSIRLEGELARPEENIARADENTGRYEANPNRLDENQPRPEEYFARTEPDQQRSTGKFCLSRFLRNPFK